MAVRRLGTLGLSEQLRSFVADAPLERRPILDFVMRQAVRLPSGSRVADVGGKEAPYRELFDHCDYVTVDWELSLHEEPKKADAATSAYAIARADRSFDAIVLTEVLEHVREPADLLEELHRLLRPGGRLLVTVPFAFQLHEMPFDFFRYTRFGLEHLLGNAGFEQIEITANSDSFTALAQLMRNAGRIMGRAPDGLDELRDAAAAELDRLADELLELAPLDARVVFPLGYAASAIRPEETGADDTSPR